MHSTSPYRQITSKEHSGIKTAPRRAPALPDEDHRQLRQYLKQPGVVAQTFLKHVLRHKISATAQSCDEIRDDVVTGSSYVTYSVDGAPAQTGLLHHRPRRGSDCGLDCGVIPVCSNLGAALIGMRVGQRAPLLREDGTITSLRVLKVAHSA